MKHRCVRHNLSCDYANSSGDCNASDCRTIIDAGTQLIVRVYNRDLECDSLYFNVVRIEDRWNGFRLWLKDGFYKDFDRDCTWEVV